MVIYLNPTRLEVHYESPPQIAQIESLSNGHRHVTLGPTPFWNQTCSERTPCEDGRQTILLTTPILKRVLKPQLATSSLQPRFTPSHMKVESFVFDPTSNNGSGLKMAAKRYTSSSRSSNATHGLTLLFTHCIGSHKEQWEPIIEYLFHSQSTKDERVRIREAWSFDWQNHGDSAVLNREALRSRPEGISVYEWTPAVVEFLRSPRMAGHRIIPIGHSAGAATSILLTKDIPSHRFASVVLVEPTLVTRELFTAHLEDRMSQMDFAVAATSSRRNHWQSREQAFEYFKKRVPWEFWDRRVLRLLVEHGLEDSPSGEVTLKGDRMQEAVSYPDVEPHFEGALQIGRICRSVPVHIIWGTRNDLVPEFIQESLSDVSKGLFVASVSKVKRSGHMVVQENPDLLASAIINIIDGLGDSSAMGVHKSKL